MRRAWVQGNHWGVSLLVIETGKEWTGLTVKGPGRVTSILAQPSVASMTYWALDDSEIAKNHFKYSSECHVPILPWRHIYLGGFMTEIWRDLDLLKRVMPKRTIIRRFILIYVYRLASTLRGLLYNCEGGPFWIELVLRAAWNAKITFSSLFFSG